MSTRQNSALSLRPDDILFILGRHKKKIIAAFLLGLGAAAALFVTEKPSYVSKAKIMVRYIMETRSLGPVSGMRTIRDTDQGAQSLINSELEILTSQDLLKRVVTEVGPERIVRNSTLTNVFNPAVVRLGLGLKVQMTPRSEVINVSFQHSDPEVARDVLTALVRIYQQKHSEVHRNTEITHLSEQTDAISAKLLETEDALRKALSNAGVSSLSEAKTDIASRIGVLRRAIAEQEAELAGEAAMYDSLTGGTHSATNSTNSAVASVEPAEGVTNSAVAVTSAVPSEVVPAVPYDPELYTRFAREVAQLKARELELLATYTTNSFPVQQVRNQIAEINKILLTIAPPTPQQNVYLRTVPTLAATPLPVSRVPAISARLNTLKDQLAQALEESKRIDTYENTVRQLERRKELDETTFKYFSTALEQAKIDNNLSAAMLNNISVIQHPSIASPAPEKPIKMAAAGGLPIALVLLYVFSIELLWPKGFARPKDIESALKLPLIGVIPAFQSRRGKKRVNGDGQGLVKAQNGAPLEVMPWDDNDAMLPYYEALRDRLEMSYQGDTHKPKIVGITSCSPGAGVTRLATGVAAALSRDFQREVLYIGLEKNKVALSAFSKGRPSALGESIGDAPGESDLPMKPVHENLMSLANTGRNLVGASAVQSFCELMPRLKTSNYDYIIFDLPPLSQTSGSLRLATQMERTVLVVEAEETSRDKAARAAAILAKSNANVSVVLNKVREANPEQVEQ